MSESIQQTNRFAQIMHDPLSYIHLQRLNLPRALNTPRQRAAVNEMLVDGLPRIAEKLGTDAATRQLLTYWRLWPDVCSLMGAQLLRQELAWRGDFLRLSRPVRFFMTLPLHGRAASGLSRERITQVALPSGLQSAGTSEQVQGLGLCELLKWQRNAPQALKKRLRLLFSPGLDDCFEHAERNSVTPDLFLISQAIQYAKNHTDHV